MQIELSKFVPNSEKSQVFFRKKHVFKNKNKQIKVLCWVKIV